MITDLIDQTWATVRDFVNRFQTFRIEKLLTLTANTIYVLDHITRRFVTVKFFQIATCCDSLIERLQFWVSQIVFKAICSCHHQTDTRLTIPYKVGDQTDFVQQIGAKRMGFVDQQQHSVGALLTWFEKVDQRQTRFTFGHAFEWQAQLKQKGLQEFLS